jgi:outer membrane protein assembly factor BamB
LFGIDPTQHPDFSAHGAPLEFGFAMEEGTELGVGPHATVTPGFNNWSLTVIPEARTLVSVSVTDGRGGSDEQNFAIQVARPSEIHGFVFSDLNGNGIWDRGPTLLVSTGADVRRCDASTGVLVDAIVPSARDGVINTHSGMTFGPDGNLYVSSWDADSVLRYNPTTGALIDVFIPPQSGGLVTPYGLAFGPDGNLYVVNHALGSVFRYNGKTRQFIDVFASSGVLAHPRGLAFGPDGNLYVVGQPNGAVLKFDGKTGAFLGTFTNGASLDMPQDLTFGPDGNLYVSSWITNEILKYNGSTGAFISLIQGPGSGGLSGPWGLAFGPDGNLYVSSQLSGQVLKYDPSSGAFLGVFASLDLPRSPFEMVFSPSAPQPEPGLVGWTVFIDENHDGRLDPNDPSTTTHQFGQFAFSDLADGTYTIAEVPQAGWTQTAPAARTYQVTVSGGQIVYDINFGNQKGNTPDQPPAITSTAPVKATVGQLYRYDVAANDPDGDALTFDLPVKPVGMSIDPETGTIVRVPTADEVGPHPVTLRVTDSRGTVTLQNFTVIVTEPNLPPIITSKPPTQAVVGVPLQYQVHAQEPEGEPTQFQLSGPLAGMAIDPNTGTFTWTPTSAELGPQQVTIVAVDSAGAQTSQMFTIKVVAALPNSSPKITSTPGKTVGLGNTYVYLVQAADPDSDPLSYSLPIAPADMTISSQGLILWKSTAGQLGPNEVTVQVDDGRGGTFVQEFMVDVVTHQPLQAPAIVSQPPTAATVGRLYSYDVSALDPQGSPFLFFLDQFPACRSTRCRGRCAGCRPSMRSAVKM